MADEEKLISAGWKLIGTRRFKYGLIKCWDHRDHNPGRRGYLTQSEALSIQRTVDIEARRLSRPEETGKLRFS